MTDEQTHTLSFRISGTSTQKATALRDRLAKEITEEDGVLLIDSNQARNSQRFRVVGVDTAGDDPFIETIEAMSEDEAKAQAVGKSKTRLVAEVRTDPTG